LGNRLESRPWIKTFAGIFIGAVLGWGYYYLIGCRSGNCAITGDPVNSSIFGGVLGLILVFPFNKKE